MSLRNSTLHNEQNPVVSSLSSILVSLAKHLFAPMLFFSVRGLLLNVHACNTDKCKSNSDFCTKLGLLLHDRLHQYLWSRTACALWHSSPLGSRRHLGWIVPSPNSSIPVSLALFARSIAEQSLALKFFFFLLFPPYLGWSRQNIHTCLFHSRFWNWATKKVFFLYISTSPHFPSF